MDVRVKTAKRSGFSEQWVRGWVKKATAALGRTEDDIAVIFTDARKIRKLNREYRGIDQPTEVLSFPADEKGDMGDIFIAPAMARVKAKERESSYRQHLALLIVHSVLHLGGYDHRTEKEAMAMARMEKKIFKRL